MPDIHDPDTGIDDHRHEIWTGHGYRITISGCDWPHGIPQAATVMLDYSGPSTGLCGMTWLTPDQARRVAAALADCADAVDAYAAQAPPPPWEEIDR
jgi:hypothetical protein